MAGLGRRTHYRKHLTDSILYDLPVPGPSERIAKVASTRGSNQFDVIVSTTATTTATTSQPSSSSSAPERADADDGPGPDRSPQLAILPTKFRKLVWIKRNDYVIVDTGETPSTDDKEQEGDHYQHEVGRSRNDGDGSTHGEGTLAEASGGGVRLIITHILYRDQVKHLKVEGIWPSHDPEFGPTQPNGGDGDDDDEHGDGASSSEGDFDANPDQGGDDDGIVYEDEDDGGGGGGELFVNTNRVAALKVDDSSSSDEESERSQ